MRVHLFFDLAVEVTQDELDRALVEANKRLPPGSTLLGAIYTEVLRSWLYAGLLSPAAYKHPERY